MAFYYPNHFVIRLTEDSPFYEADADDNITWNQEFIAIYLHEYLHYWHNISTLSGAKSLVWTHLVLVQVGAALLRGVDPGANGLAFNESEQDAIRELLIYRDLQEGDQWFQGVADTQRICAVDAMEFKVTTVRFPHGPVEGRYLDLTVVSKGPRGEVRGTFRFGAWAVEESLALLMQERIELTGSRVDAAYAPDFPYRVAPAVMKAVLGTEPDPFVCFAIGTLALQNSFPGPAFYDLTVEYRRLLGTGLSSVDAVLRLAQMSKSAQHALAAVALADLIELREQHSGRAQMGEAFAYYIELFRRAQALRSENPIFDAVTMMADAPEKAAAALLQLQLDFRACNAIQERAGCRDIIERDFVVENDGGLGHAAFLLQCQQHFASVQASASQGFDVSERRCCPLYTSCTLQMRQESPDVCAQRPWLRNTPGVKTCAYGVAVAALTGKLTSTPVATGH